MAGSDSQRCDLDELAEQLDPLRQRLALQDLGGDPVLHLAAALQNQLQVQGAPAGLLAMKHVTHELHLQETHGPVLSRTFKKSPSEGVLKSLFMKQEI